MNVERAIYGSLPIGIDSGSNGLQYYSYTPGFKKILEQDNSGLLKGLSTGFYKFPAGSDWLRKIPEGIDISGDLSEYPLVIPETVSQANDLEKIVKLFSPYCFCYRNLVIDNESVGVFLFGKNLGMDWSGRRPGNPYIYTTVCGMDKIEQQPIFYCSSPAVVCNILRKEFYTEDSIPQKPNLLSYINSLDEENKIAPLEYSAGFEAVTADKIVEFIKTEGNIDIFISMLSALMEYKDGNIRRRIVIADSCDNIIMWIAALSFVFPVYNTRKLSFTSYTYMPEDYDINGVFVPSLNSCPSSAKTGYDFNLVRNAYAVFDFNENYYAPDIAETDELFLSVVKNSFEISTSLISNYKDYISSRTTYTKMDSDYTIGYHLFAYMNNMVKFKLQNAVDFAIKYANLAEKKELLNRLITDCVMFSENEADVAAIKKYVNFCIENGIEDKNTICSEYTNKYDILFFNNESDDNELQLYNYIANEVFGISNDSFAIFLAEKNKLEDICEFVKTTRSTWRILYINRALCLFANAKNIPVDLNTKIGKIQSKIISRLVSNDSNKNVQQVKEYINELFSVLTKVSMRVGLCDCILHGLQENNLKNCSNQVINIITDMYINGDSSLHIEMMRIICASENADTFIKSILVCIQKEIDINRIVMLIQDLFVYHSDVTLHFADEAKHIVLNTLENKDISSKKIRLKNIYSTYKFLCFMSSEHGVHVSTAEYQKVYDLYILCVIEDASDYVVESYIILQLAEMTDHLHKAGCNVNAEMLRVFKSLNAIKNDIGTRKNPSCFSFTNAPFERVDLSKINHNICENYIKSLALLCAEHWIATGKIPVFQQMFLADQANKHRYSEYVFNIMFRQYLKNIKHNGRQAADILELSMLWHYDSVLENIDSWIIECDVSSSMVSCLEKDIKIKEEAKNSRNDELLDKIDCGKLQDYTRLIKDYFDNNNGSGVLNTIKSIFKRKK